MRMKSDKAFTFTHTQTHTSNSPYPSHSPLAFLREEPEVVERVLEVRERAEPCRRRPSHSSYEDATQSFIREGVEAAATLGLIH